MTSSYYYLLHHCRYLQTCLRPRLELVDPQRKNVRCRRRRHLRLFRQTLHHFGSFYVFWLVVYRM